MVNLLDANGWNLSRSLQHCERLLLEAALHLTHGNQSQTARLLESRPAASTTRFTNTNCIRKNHLPPARPCRRCGAPCSWMRKTFSGTVPTHARKILSGLPDGGLPASFTIDRNAFTIRRFGEKGWCSRRGIRLAKT